VENPIRLFFGFHDGFKRLSTFTCEFSPAYTQGIAEASSIFPGPLGCERSEYFASLSTLRDRATLRSQK
jgi:hypothetical protein